MHRVLLCELKLKLQLCTSVGEERVAEKCPCHELRNSLRGSRSKSAFLLVCKLVHLLKQLEILHSSNSLSDLKQ